METYTITVSGETYTARKLTGFELLDIIGEYQQSGKLGNMFKTLILESVIDEKKKTRLYRENDLASWNIKRISAFGTAIMENHQAEANEDFPDSETTSQEQSKGLSRFM